MTWDVQISWEAEDDLDRIRDYLAKQSASLAGEFTSRFNRKLESLEHHPEAFARVGDDTRACKVEKFEYVLYFRIRPLSRVKVFAVLHSHQRASTWRNRI